MGETPHNRVAVCVCGGGASWLTFHGVPEAQVGAAVHGSGVVLAQAEGELHVCRRWEPLHHVPVVVARVPTQRAFLSGIA